MARIGRRRVAPALVAAAAVAAAAAAAAVRPAAATAATAAGAFTPAVFLGSKTPYWPQQIGDREPMPGHCKLVHVNHVGAFARPQNNRAPGPPAPAATPFVRPPPTAAQ